MKPALPLLKHSKSYYKLNFSLLMDGLALPLLQMASLLLILKMKQNINPFLPKGFPI